ncbi:MAG: nucleotidyltransferase family protein [Clostridiales bacterium]|nr:nucleotidyltransferase family protein [Clostridiales bacterium]
MKAIIMAGGLGSRLRPLTNEIPKPMVPIIDKPIMLYIIELLRAYDFNDIAVALNYKPDVIIDYFKDGSAFGVRLTYFIESSPLGTAGCVKNAADFLGDNFLAISGDSFTDIDLKAFSDFHFRKNASFSLACKRLENTLGFGVLETERDGRIVKFIEKPDGGASGLVNTGIYIINKSVMDLIPDGFYDFGKDLLPKLADGGSRDFGKLRRSKFSGGNFYDLAKNGASKSAGGFFNSVNASVIKHDGRLYAYKTDCYWSDVGSLPAYYSTNYFVANNMDFFYRR